MSLTYLTDSIELLLEAFPRWWKTDVGSELRKQLDAIASLGDDLATETEGIYADQTLATARDGALRTEWARLYGAQNEVLPIDTETLRAYLVARSQEDGTFASLLAALIALLSTPGNSSTTPLTWDASGTNLVFPTDPAQGIGPLSQGVALQPYPRLAFPTTGGMDFASTGGLDFPAGGWLEVIDSATDHRIVVTVRNWLSFDRAAFARAVERHRPLHHFAASITETSS